MLRVLQCKTVPYIRYVYMRINVCRIVDDAGVINLDTDDDDNGDDEERAGHISTQSCTSAAWDLSRAALQVEQMIDPRYRTAPLGNLLFLLDM